MEKNRIEVQDEMTRAASELADHASEVRALLMVELRWDGSYTLARVNATLPEEMGMAEMALTDAKQRFVRGHHLAPTTQSTTVLA